jgi:large subunit ribosomal protein L38
VEVDLDEVKSEWFKTGGPLQAKKIAEHYGIYKDLFGKFAFFVPRVQLNIRYPLSEDSYHPVFTGNRIEPYVAREIPEVSFDHKFSLSYQQKPEEDTLWTLVLTNPDGHMTQDTSEYVHWMISNIPKGDISKGDQIVPYLQPIPFKGTGYHRYVFVLYKQDKKLDLSEFKVSDVNNLEKRTFLTFDFYKKYQDILTPAGMSFFQSKWDETVGDVLHDTFGKS